MEPIGIGIVGCAHACRDLHRPVLVEHTEQFEVRALYDLDRSRAESEAAEFGPPAEVMDSLDDLLAREEVELVFVLTKPPTTHHEVAMAAARAGKHLFVEKPLAATTAECDEMIQAAEEAGVVFAVHQNRRPDVNFNELLDVLESGRLGDPQLIRISLPHAGTARDWASHVVDQALLLGRGNLVQVRGWTQYPERASEEQGFGFMELEFEQRPLVIMEMIPGRNDSGTAFPLFYVAGDKDFYTTPCEHQWPNMHPIYDGLYRAIREGAPTPVHPSIPRNVIYCFELMEESSRQGRPLPADDWLPAGPFMRLR